MHTSGQAAWGADAVRGARGRGGRDALEMRGARGRRGGGKAAAGRRLHRSGALSLVIIIDGELSATMRAQLSTTLTSPSSLRYEYKTMFHFTLIFLFLAFVEFSFCCEILILIKVFDNNSSESLSSETSMNEDVNWLFSVDSSW